MPQGAGWHLLRILLVVAAGLVPSLFSISPAHADEDDSVTIVGTVWIDENADGIRQPSEPGVPGDAIHAWINGLYGDTLVTDERGHFSLTLRRPSHRAGMRGYFPGASIRLYSYHLRPGDEPVFERSSGYSYTHFGCAIISVKPGDPERTEDIRLVHDPDDGSIPPLNWPLADGHFFKEAAPRYLCDRGYSVTNADGIPFWDTWQELGLENVGYPTSGRYLWRGFITQTFQKAVIQWHPGKGVFFVNVFDELHDAGYDDELRVFYSTPKQLPPSFFVDTVGKQEGIQTRRLALLDANPAIKERYYAVADPLLRYGLPSSRVEDYGNVFVMRTQKAVFQQWKEEVPWAKAGEVTIANGADIAKALSGWSAFDEVDGYVRILHIFSPDEALRRYERSTSDAP